MSKSTESELETPAWYYQRFMLCRGRPGTLSLRNGKLVFLTGPVGSATNSWYENDDKPDHVLFDLSISDIHEVSCHWWAGGLSIEHADGRHLVTFVGPTSGRHVQDAINLTRGLSTLQRWRTVLEREGVFL